MNKFVFKEKLFYKTPDGRFEFYPNSRDGPGVYDVVIKGKDHIYIPDRTLGDLTNPEISSVEMMQRLENLSGQQIHYILRENSILFREFHEALINLRKVKEREDKVQQFHFELAKLNS